METCKKCGATLREGAQFCAECGAPIGYTPEQEVNTQKFNFQKGKMLGRVTYKRTSTNVEISSTSLKIRQTMKKIFRKEREEEKAIPLSQIKSARVHVVLDFWDTLYAAIFAVLGFFQPVLFLMAAVCLWCGYGREIEILTSNNDKIKIPLAFGKTDAETVVSICNHNKD